ncbi:MAG: hypothetical protein ACK5M7_16185 [Draconibacterium sp.]
MKGLTKVYWRLFISYGALFGLLMSLWDVFAKREVNFYKTTFIVVFFGGFMSWRAVKSMKDSKKRLGGGELTEEDFKASQSEVIPKNRSIELGILSITKKSVNWGNLTIIIWSNNLKA